MTQHEWIQEEVRKTLGLLRQLPPLEGNPFLYTRVRARLDNVRRSAAGETSRGRLAAFLRFALLSVLIAVNVFTFARHLSGSDNVSTSRSDLVRTIVQEYALGPDPRTQWLLSQDE